jgi:hypothetical protein
MLARVLLSSVVLLLPVFFASSGDGAVAPASWMHDLTPVIEGHRVLDLSFPGTHDALTCDLSLRIAENSNDLPPWLSDLLHKYFPGFNNGTFAHKVESFIRDQARTQVSNITAQLNAGIRFIDFRITYTQGPQNGAPYEWYGLHTLETVHPALTYLREVFSPSFSRPRLLFLCVPFGLVLRYFVLFICCSFCDSTLIPSSRSVRGSTRTQTKWSCSGFRVTPVHAKLEPRNIQELLLQSARNSGTASQILTLASSGGFCWTRARLP